MHIYTIDSISSCCSAARQSTRRRTCHVVIRTDDCADADARHGRADDCAGAHVGAGRAAAARQPGIPVAAGCSRVDAEQPGQLRLLTSTCQSIGQLFLKNQTRCSAFRRSIKNPTRETRTSAATLSHAHPKGLQIMLIAE